MLAESVVNGKPMNDTIGFVLRGRFVHAVGAPGELEFIEDGCVAVGEDGALRRYGTGVRGDYDLRRV